MSRDALGNISRNISQRICRPSTVSARGCWTFRLSVCALESTPPHTQGPTMTRAIPLLILALTACTPAAVTALEILAPVAIDALAQLVSERWGSDAEVDKTDTSCWRTDDHCGAQIVGDDDRAYVYTTCRAKAL